MLILFHFKGLDDKHKFYGYVFIYFCMIFYVKYSFQMQIMDTSPNLVFLQEYHEKQIKQQEKKQKMAKSPKSQHWLRNVVTSGEKSLEISNSSQS